MEKVCRSVADVARDLVLLTPKLGITCPHCKTHVKGNELIPLDDAPDYFEYRAGGKLQPVLGSEQREMSAMSQMMILPVHKGITPAQLVQSVEDAKDHPLLDLYNMCVTTHNMGPHAGQKTYVWGAGNPNTAKVLMIGEAPGWQEDKFGIPFIGDAGQWLSSVLNACGISRALDVLLINTVCTVPDRLTNSTEIGKPRSVDMLEQRPRVIKIIEILKDRPGNPLKAVVCLGKYPWAQLTEQKRLFNAYKTGEEMNMRDITVGRIKGWHGDGVPDVNVPVLATYHPSFIMRTASNAGKPPSQVPELVEYFETFKNLGEKINGKR